ncbi:MAG: oligoribonuclease, partial [Aeromicrobium sp.]
LNILGTGVDIVIKPPAAALDQMNEFVTQMHTTSGLINELDAGVSVREAEEQVLDFIREFVPEPRKAPLAGNSIATDRSFINRDMTELDDWLHYRMIDVSSIKMLAREWYPRAYFNAPEKSGNHRALADIVESIEELRYYRQTVFWPEPGIDSDGARAAAEAIAAART